MGLRLPKFDDIPETLRPTSLSERLLQRFLGPRAPSIETLVRVNQNMDLPEKEKLPLVAAFYITFACNARCWFCSQGENVFGDNRNAYKKDRKNLDQALRILEAIRKDVPNIYFLGGEPTIFPGIGEALKRARELDFGSVGINTNGIKFVPEVLEYCDLLVISMHSMDAPVIEDIYQIAEWKGDKVRSNVERYIRERDPKKTRVVLNCVATPQNMGDIADVARFAAMEGVEFNLAPAVGPYGEIDPEIINDPRYIALVEWLMQFSDLASGTQYYLDMIKDPNKGFSCDPHIIPGIHPDGRMIVPCPNLREGHELINVLTHGVIKGLKIGREIWELKHGPLRTRVKCRKDCRKACYVELSDLTPEGIIERLSIRTKHPTRPIHIRDLDEIPGQFTPEEADMHESDPKRLGRYNLDQYDQSPEGHALKEVYGYARYGPHGPYFNDHLPKEWANSQNDTPNSSCDSERHSE